MATLKLCSPWNIYYKELTCLFEKDKEITIVYDEETPEIRLYVENPAKAYALSKLLPEEKVFGALILKITVIPSNEIFGIPNDNLYRLAFKGNPVVDSVREIDTPFMGKITYVIFVKEVVQYFNDNIFDANGICSTLYQTIAKNVFAETDYKVSYCTFKRIESHVISSIPF